MKLFSNTEGGKIGGLDGLNLFFGALLGANLGTLENVPLFDYVKIVVFLAGTVITIRMISTSKERGPVLLLVAFYAALIGSMLVFPDAAPEGMSDSDLERLVATLAIWMSCVLLIEFSPTKVEKPADADEASAGGEPQA
jgi:predicted membrane channel-forming protein YqfA (hemolysin III family)